VGVRRKVKLFVETNNGDAEWQIGHAMTIRGQKQDLKNETI